MTYMNQSQYVPQVHLGSCEQIEFDILKSAKYCKKLLRVTAQLEIMRFKVIEGNPPVGEWVTSVYMHVGKEDIAYPSERVLFPLTNLSGRTGF